MFSCFFTDIVSSLSELPKAVYPDLYPTPFDHSNYLLNWLAPVVFAVVASAAVLLVFAYRRNKKR